MPFGSLGTIWSEIGLDTRKLDQGLMKAHTKLAAADKSITTWGQKLTNQSTKLITAGGLMAGAVAAVGVATVKMAKDFEVSMRNVNSIARLSEKEFADMSGEVIDLSKELPQSAKVLADGLYDISSSGFAGAEGLEVLEAAAKAASAGITDTATSAKGITAVLNAYGWEAERAAEVSDIMFKTVDKGVITFEELSATVGDWIGMAGAANLSFEEASGAIAYMTTKGIGAAEAGTSLQRMLTGIIKPSEQMAEMLRAAGYESGEMALKQLGLAGTMKLVNDATGGSITKLLELLPEIRGVRGANALLGAGYEELTGYMQQFNDTTGATQKALDEQSKSLDFQLQLLRNNISAIGITLGTDLIPSVTETVTKLTEWISANDDLTVNLIKVGGGITAIMSSILLLGGALGKLRVFITTAGGAMSLAVAAPIAFTVAMDQLSDVIENKFARTILEGLSPMQTMVESFRRLSDAMGEYKKGNISFMEALLMSREEAEKLGDTYKSVNDGLQGYDKYMGSATSTTNKASTAISEFGEEAETATEQLNAFIESLFELYNLNQSVTEAGWAYEDALKAQKEAIDEYGAGSREAQEAIFGTQDALEDYINSIWDEYSAEGTSLQRKAVLLTTYKTLGEEAVKRGEISEQAFKDMLSEFEKTVGGIGRGVSTIKGHLDSIPRKITIDVDVKYNQEILRLPGAPKKPGGAMGGMVTPYGVMQSFASGGVVPQTGTAIPILAHEGEMILNSSQQSNLINALWGVANGKSSGGSVVNNFNIAELIVREEADVDRIAGSLYNMQQTRSRLG